MSHSNSSQETAIFGLWLKWIVAEGALFIPYILSVYIPALYIPVVCIALAVGLLIFERSSKRTFSLACPLILSVSVRSLLTSAAIMVIVSVIYRHGWYDYFMDPTTVNPAIPYVTSLIISPVVLMFAGWAVLRGNRFGVCRQCLVEFGSKSERGQLGELITREGRYQLFFLTSISAVLTIFTWVYYMVWYVNININIPDRFVFGWVPAVLYVVSLFYMGARYFTLWSEYFEESGEADSEHPASTALRILIIHGNSIFLTSVEHTEFDTPTAFGIPYEKRLPQGRAGEIFSKLTGIEPDKVTMRYLYTSREAALGHNAFHYVCTPNTPGVIEENGLHGSWYNLSQFTSLYQNRELTPMLAAEIYRIYTVAMAWKTYDKDGRRLYKVKNYRPLFRLEGICDWDVDFDSPHWLYVSRFNQDRPFWRLRRMFNRISLTQQ